MNWSGMMLGVMFLLTVAVLVIVAVYYTRSNGCGSSSSCSSSNSCGRCPCPTPVTTGATGCLVRSQKTDCDTFQLRMDESAAGKCVSCVRGTLTVKKPLLVDELILTAQVPTGTFVTDIWAQVVPACGHTKPRKSDFPEQTGCTVDTSLGYTHFFFACTGGSNTQSVSLTLPTGVRDHAFLSVVAGIAQTCGTPLEVDTLTIEGHEVPHSGRCCPKPPCLVPGTCNPPAPRAAYIKIPRPCRNLV